MVAIIWLRLELKHIYNGFNKSLLILGRRDLNSLKKSDYVYCNKCILLCDVPMQFVCKLEDSSEEKLLNLLNRKILCKSKWEIKIFL